MKKRTTKPVSKLSILFILAILIPGIVLTYFSIQNISSQKELTEKRLLEEQNKIAAQLADKFHQKLVDCANRFFNHVDNLSPKLQNKIFYLDTLEGIDQTIIINTDGNFIYPNYANTSAIKPTGATSQDFTQTILEGERSEFAESDLRKATQSYRKAVQIANNNFEKAAAINRLARVWNKRGYKERAREQYLILINSYGSVIDDSGIPFAHYAFHQLLQISNKNKSKLIADISTILCLLATGEIALTDQTEFLLSEILDWLEKENQANSQAKEKITLQIASIRKLLSFVSQVKNPLRQYLAKKNQSIFYPTLSEYEVITGTLGNLPGLLVINRSSGQNRIVGFKVNLNHIKDQSLAEISKEDVSFNSNIDILPREQVLKAPSNPLTTIKEVSPLVPLWRISISPENPKVMQRYITRQRWIYGIALTLLVAGMLFGVILVLRDISREQKLARLRSDFVSNVTHELKTPLTSIRMFAETMLMGRIKKKSDQNEYLSIIVNESERLTRLINTVLDFSKIEQGRKHYNLIQTNISKVVSSAIHAMKHSLNEAGFDLKTEVPADIQTVADADAIEQAVLNLLSNAVKYSNSNKKIKVKLFTENDSIFIQVVDKGMGIPEIEQKKIFEKYYRAHNKHEKDTGGAGLGLTVVQHIVDAHNGKIRLESIVGEGSTFTIILPEQY